MSKWYGSLNNRLEENNQFCETIEVGTGVTEYFWSDQHPYEVVEVEDQKHVSIRPMKHVKAKDSSPMDNNWDILPDPEAQSFKIVKRGNYWYRVSICTPELAKEILEGDEIQSKLWLCNNGFDGEEIIASGKPKKKYHKMNISFGVAQYYYDYEF